MGVKGLLKYTSEVRESVPGMASKAGPEPAFVEFINSMVINPMDKKDGYLLLDIGCGYGLESDYAQKNGFNVVAIDKDYGCVRKTKERNAHVDARQADFFDFIKDVKRNAFSHVIDSRFSNKLTIGRLKRYYQSISKTLRYNGYFFLQILSTGDDYCKSHCPIRKWTKIDDEYIRYFDGRELEKLLHDSGIKITEFKTIKQKEGDEERTYYVVIARQIIKRW